MVTVPAFLLRRLYVKKSLKNTDYGFEFELRNRLGSGYAFKLWPLTVDGEELPPDDTVFLLEGEETAFSEVSKGRTFTLAMNRTITIKANGASLESGPRKIGMGLGTLRFDFTDIVGDE